jgi:hypothetical protein
MVPVVMGAFSDTGFCAPLTDLDSAAIMSTPFSEVRARFASPLMRSAHP